MTKGSDMPRATFTADFDFVPDAQPRVTIAYLKGQTLPVTGECLEKAVAAGKAEPAKPDAQVTGAQAPTA